LKALRSFTLIEGKTLANRGGTRAFQRHPASSNLIHGSLGNQLGTLF
jgi:hypothetical protein